VLGVKVLRPGDPAKNINSPALAICPKPTVLMNMLELRITSIKANAARVALYQLS
jgi:hypothetical protein